MGFGANAELFHFLRFKIMCFGMELTETELGISERLRYDRLPVQHEHRNYVFGETGVPV